MQSAALLDWTERGIFYVESTRTSDLFTVPMDPVEGRAAGSPRPIAYWRTGRNISPVWSPDGGRLAFVSSAASEPNRRFVVVMPAAGGQPREFLIPTTSWLNERAPFDLRWFGDGRGLGLSGHDTRGAPAVFRLRLDTGEWDTIPLPEQQYLTRTEWNQDGSAFYFARMSVGKDAGGIFERAVNAGGERLVYRSPAPPFSLNALQFSPDRKWLAFYQASVEADRHFVRILVVDVGTGDTRTLAVESVPAGSNEVVELNILSWTPSGDLLVHRRSPVGPGVTRRKPWSCRWMAVRLDDLLFQASLPVRRETRQLRSSRSGRPMDGRWCSAGGAGAGRRSSSRTRWRPCAPRRSHAEAEDRMRHSRLVSTLSALALFSVVLMSQTPSGHAIFEQALAKERVEGNLPEAIRLYERVVAEFASDRALAARALVQIGLSYEKLGRDEAVRVYERLVRDFSDQTEAAEQARTRLAALQRPHDVATRTGAASTSPARRLLWDGTATPVAPANAGSLTRDGSTQLRYHDRQRAWELFDPATAGVRQLTSDGPSPEEAIVSDFLNELSPDGRRVAAEVRIPTPRPREFERFEIRVFEAGSRGPGRVLATWDGKELFQVRPFAWSPQNDRVWLFVMRADQSAQIASVDMNGKLEVLKTLTWRGHTQPPSLSPDGRFLAYHDAVARQAPNDLYILATDGSREQRIEHPAEDGKPIFVPDGSGVVFESNRRGYRDLWFQAIADGRPSGQPRLVWRNIGHYGTAVRFTDAGSLVYYFLVNEWSTYTTPLDLTAAEPVGEPTRVAPVNNESNSGAAFSPDGRYLAHFRDNAARLVIRELSSGFEREIPFGVTLRASYAALDWCPGGEALIATGYDDGMIGFRITVKDASVQRLSVTPAARPAPRCVGNGEEVIYSPSTQSGVRTAAVRRSMTSGHETTVYHGDVRSIARSLDGSRLAMVVVDPDGKRARLLTMSADGSDVSADLMSRETIQVSPQDIHRPTFVDVAWMPTGDRLLVAQLDSFGPGSGPVHSIWTVPVDGGPARKLNPLRLARVQGRDYGIGALTIHPGGKLLAFQRHEGVVEQMWAIDNLAQFIKASGR
jgi:hypothetical protein